MAENDTAEPNTLKDKFGNEREYDAERYPEGSAAREGNITPPSGQGGAMPKARPDHQDMFPANPEPSESAAKKGEENDAVDRGDVSPVNPDLDRGSKTSAKTTKAKSSDK